MNKKIIAVGLLIGIVAILLGAFGAHSLKKILTEQELITFEVGVKYQMYHALFLLFIGGLPILEKIKLRAFYFILTGILFFSGSVYIISLKNVLGIEIGKFGIITPIGGVLLVLGWFVILLHLISKK